MPFDFESICDKLTCVLRFEVPRVLLVKIQVYWNVSLVCWSGVYSDQHTNNKELYMQSHIHTAFTRYNVEQIVLYH